MSPAMDVAHAHHDRPGMASRAAVLCANGSLVAASAGLRGRAHWLVTATPSGAGRAAAPRSMERRDRRPGSVGAAAGSADARVAS